MKNSLPSILTPEACTIPKAEAFQGTASLLIATPPRKRSQHNLLTKPMRILQSVKKLSSFDQKDRALLTQIADQLPTIASVKTASITLRPAVRSQQLQEAIYDLCAYYIQLRREGRICYPGSLKDEMAFYPEERPDHQIWCAVNVRSYERISIISIARDSKHECDETGQPLISDYTAEYLRGTCVSDCAILVQNFLDDLRQTAVDRLMCPDCTVDTLPKLESVAAHRIVFSNFNQRSSRLYDSGILTVLNRAKNVYTKGDPAGRKAYRQKRKLQQPVLNSGLRMEVAYTVRQDNDRLIVEFWFDSSNKPYFLLPCSHGTRRTMTAQEAQACRLSFAQLCAAALEAYFEQIHSQATLHNVTPDYLQTWPNNQEGYEPQNANSPLEALAQSVMDEAAQTTVTQ